MLIGKKFIEDHEIIKHLHLLFLNTEIFLLCKKGFNSCCHYHCCWWPGDARSYIGLVYREYSGFNTTCFNSNIFSSNVFFFKFIHWFILCLLFISWIHLNSFGLGVPGSKLNKIENLRIYRVEDIYWNQLFAFVSENDDGDTNKNLVPLGRE